MYYVYMLTNKTNRVLYTGVTNNLSRRLQEHQNELIPGFTKRYHVHKLVYFEEFSEMNDAIAREKQIKGWKREKKDALIDSVNPQRDDWGIGFLSASIPHEPAQACIVFNAIK